MALKQLFHREITFFPQAILAKTTPVMGAAAYQRKTDTNTNASVRRDFMEKSAKKVLKEHVVYDSLM